MKSDEWLFQKIDGNDFDRMRDTIYQIDFTGDEYNKIAELLRPKGLIYYEEDEKDLFFRIRHADGMHNIDNIKISKLDDEWYIIIMWNKIRWHFYKCDTFEGLEEWINEIS